MGGGDPRYSGDAVVSVQLEQIERAVTLFANDTMW